MRIVSYNILDGGEGRADPLAEVILAQRPDIVALVEADQSSVVERIAHRAHMDFIHATGGKKGAALLSRWPIQQTIDHTLLLKGQTIPKSLLEASILEPGGREWIIGALHLTAHAGEESEREREKEIATVLQVFKRYCDSDTPHLLVGDFNSNAPDQQIDPEKCKPATRKAWHDNGGHIPRRVVQTILDHGYLDTLRSVNPQRARTDGSFSTQYPGQRVDYVYTHGIPSGKIKHAWIEQDRLARCASDHFPIGAEIE
jgi:endonuclease/exonuclease/phosphatase family metal-dependent hydrolase